MNEIKQKKCKVCAVKFTPYKSTQVVCTPKCAIELAFSKPVKSNILRLEKKVKLQKLKTYTQRVNEVKVIFQRWIRNRDKNSPCISCGIKETKLWDGGHYKKAELYYKIIAEIDHYMLVEVDLKTGRHHQIRAQFSHIGSPLKGDDKYGFKRGNEDRSIDLLARKVVLIHPVSKEKLELVASPKMR